MKITPLTTIYEIHSTDASKVDIYKGAKETVVKELPATVYIVGIFQGVKEEVVRALPRTVLVVEINQGLIENVIRALPPTVILVRVNQGVTEQMIRWLPPTIVAASITQVVPENVVRALPSTVVSVSIHKDVTKNVVAALPSTVIQVNLVQNITEDIVPELPPTVTTVAITQGMTANIIRILPPTVISVIINGVISEDVVCAIPKTVMTVAVVDGMPTNIIRALPGHIEAIGFTTMIPEIEAANAVGEVLQLIKISDFKIAYDRIIIAMLNPMIWPLVDERIAKSLPYLKSLLKYLEHNVVTEMKDSPIWQIIERFGALNLESVTAIINQFTLHPDRDIRCLVLDALEKIASRNSSNIKSLLPYVEKGLLDTDCWVREQSVRTLISLAKVEPNLTIHLFQLAMNDQDKNIKMLLLILLEQIPQKTLEHFIPLIQAAKEDQDPEIRSKATGILDKNPTLISNDPMDIAEEIPATERSFKPACLVSAIDWSKFKLSENKINTSPLSQAMISSKNSNVTHKKKFEPKKSKFSAKAKKDIGRYGEMAIYQTLFFHYQKKYEVTAKETKPGVEFTLEAQKDSKAVNIKVLWHNEQESYQPRDLTIHKTTEVNGQKVTKERLVEVKTTTSENLNKIKFSKAALEEMRKYKKNYWLFSVFGAGKQQGKISIRKLKNPHSLILGDDEPKLPVSVVKVYIKK